MSKSVTKVTNKTELVSSNALGINVNTDDVINAFVTDFETSRDDARLKLTTAINEAKKKVDESNIKLNKECDKLTSKYEGKGKLVGIDLTVTCIATGFCTVQGVYALDQYVTSNSKQNIVNKVTAPIPAKDLAAHNKLEQVVIDLEAELGAVMHDLANLPKKTRQIRGLIAKRNLKEAGMEDLIQDTELQKLLA